MHKNGQNDLKFGHNMHYGDTNNFLVFAKKCLLFGQKINLYFLKRLSCQNWAKNCHKMHKNCQNDLKFELNMHYGDFNHFL